MVDCSACDEQDEAYEETLRQDQAASAARKVKAAELGETDLQQEEQTPPTIGPGSTEDAGGLSLRDIGLESGDGSDLSPSASEETPAQRREKIAQSFARLGFGS